MAIKNLYNNLPGHLVEFKDGGFELVSEQTNTKNNKSLLILGTAFDGPVNEPVKIDKTTVTQLFGSDVNDKGYPNGATLTKYAKQAFKNGFSDVRCMRVTGSQAYVDITKVSSSIDHDEHDVVKGEIEGCAAFGASLGKKPITNINIVMFGTQDAVSGVSITKEEGTLSFIQNAISKNGQVEAIFDYKDISAIRTETAPAGDGTNFTDIQLTHLDSSQSANAGNILFVTDKNVNGQYIVDSAGTIPTTDGVVVKFNGSVVPTTDYTVDAAQGKVTILNGNSAGITESDSVDIEYYTYKLVTNERKTIASNDTDQVITLAHTPKNGVVDLVVNGVQVNASKYTVHGNDVILTAGNFNVKDTFGIGYDYVVTETITEGITVRSIYGGSIYKEASVKIEPYKDDAGNDQCKFIFTKPESKMYSASDKPFAITSADCPTVGMLKMAVKNYALNNVFEIVTDNDDMLTSNFQAFDSKLVNGGDDGVTVTNNQMFEALSGKRNAEGYLIEQGAYQILENYHVDYVYPAGVYADSKQTVNKYSSFHHELALLCAVLTYRTKMTHGFIDVKPNSNTTLIGIQNYVDNLLQYDNDHFMKDSDGNDIVDTEGNKMDIGWYTSIVVGPEPVMISDTLGTYYGSPAIAYAALNGEIKPQSAPTNKALPGVKGMKFKFSNKQMDALVGNRMVVFKLKNEGSATSTSTPYVVDGCTAGNENCDYRRMVSVKVVTDVVDQIREVADPFLGEPNTVEQRNALSALISKRLGRLLDKGEIQYYSFEINATIEQVLLGECTISLTLVVPQELKKITTVVALKATA